jgi:hypothetical protein
VNQLTRVVCPAGSLAWASDRVGLAGLAQPKKNICMHKNKFILFVYSLMLELKIKILS